MNHTSASDRFLFKLVKSLKKDEAEVVLLFRSELRSEFLNGVVLKIRIVGFFLDFLVIKRDVLNSHGLIRTFNFKDKCNLRNRIKKKYYIFKVPIL